MAQRGTALCFQPAPQTSLPKSCFPQLRCPELLRCGLRRGFPGREASSALQKGCWCQRAELSLCPGLASPARPQAAHALRPAAPTLCCLWKFQHLFRIPPRPLKSILLGKKKNIFRSLYVQNQKVINWTGCFLPTLSWSLLFYDTPNRRNSSI